jgi:hypothetical protein
MLPFSTRNQLKEALVAIGSGEKDLESIRNIICRMSDFDLQIAFDRLDSKKLKFISSIELLPF